MSSINTNAPIVGRILIAVLFLLAGFGKLADVQGFTGYLQSGGLPGFLAWPAILFEIALGILLIIGYQTRLVGLAGAAFCVVSAVLYHNNFADQTQMVMFLKNLAIAGGFLLLAANGPGKYAMDKA
jgi:putative oxidoreductase